MVDVRCVNLSCLQVLRGNVVVAYRCCLVRLGEPPTLTSPSSVSVCGMAQSSSKVKTSSSLCSMNGEWLQIGGDGEPMTTGLAREPVGASCLAIFGGEKWIGGGGGWMDGGVECRLVAPHRVSVPFLADGLPKQETPFLRHSSRRVSVLFGGGMPGMDFPV